LSECREINVLTVVHDITTFVTIKICALRWLPPLEVEFGHPLARGVKSDWLEDMILLHHLRFLHKFNNDLGGNVHPNVSDVSEQLLNKINIVKEGTTAGVCVVMVWKCGSIANENFAPHSKPSTAPSSLSGDGSGVITLGTKGGVPGWDIASTLQGNG